MLQFTKRNLIEFAVRMRGGKPVADDINVLALSKGSEQYVYLYEDQYRAEVLRQLGRNASDQDLSFSWYDAAVLSQKIREQEREDERQREADQRRFKI